MTTQTLDLASELDRLPAGTEMLLSDIDWGGYEAILAQMESMPGHRVTFESGRITIMSPRQDHELFKEMILRMVDMVSQRTGLELETRGSTTFKRIELDVGVEPETCFYVQSAESLIRAGNQRESTPVPDVVVEVDLASSSIDKFSIYARLGVREIWRYDGRLAKFFELGESAYREIEASVAFPQLNSGIITETLELSKSQGQTAALKSFKRWLDENLPSAT